MIESLNLQSLTSDLKGVTTDLSHIDTRCKVYDYVGKESITASIESADVVFICSGIVPSGSYQNSCSTSQGHMELIAHELSKVPVFPLVIVGTYPVPFQTRVLNLHLKAKGCATSKRVVGFTHNCTSVLNRIISSAINVKPEEVNAQVAVGTEPKHMIPLVDEFCADLCEKEQSIVDSVYSDIHSECKTGHQFDLEKAPCILSQAYSAHKLISSIAESFMHRRVVCESVHAEHPSFEFFTLPTIFQRGNAEKPNLDHRIEEIDFIFTDHPVIERLKTEMKYFDGYATEKEIEEEKQH